MTVSLRDGQPATEAAILQLERVLGLRLNHQFRTFVSKHNGAVPEENAIIVPGSLLGVSQFIPVEEIPAESGNFRELPSLVYAIAYDDCGNFFVIDESMGGAVLFYDHELHEPYMFVASGLDAFLKMLRPGDGDVVLGPGGTMEVIYRDPEVRAHADRVVYGR